MKLNLIVAEFLLSGSPARSAETTLRAILTNCDRSGGRPPSAKTTAKSRRQLATRRLPCGKQRSANPRYAGGILRGAVCAQSSPSQLNGNRCGRNVNSALAWNVALSRAQLRKRADSNSAPRSAALEPEAAPSSVWALQFPPSCYGLAAAKGHIESIRAPSAGSTMPASAAPHSLQSSL